MFTVDFGDAVLGGLIAVSIGGLHLSAQLRSEEEKLDWREPLLTSILLAASMGFNEAFQGVIGGDNVAWGDGAEMAFFLCPFIVAGSLVGRAAGRVLQRL
jgi:hypothetical protein